MKVKGKTFLYCSFIGFGVSILLYILFFNFLIQKDIFISHSYKEFLLENTESPRLIIDSGSNSQHSINSMMLEKELNILTINISDNGSYPLRQKLLRLERYAKEGDVVILPLEWGHYTYRNPTLNFLDNIFISLNFYYNSLVFLEKIKLIAQTPFSSFVKALLRNDKKSTQVKLQNEYLSLQDHKDSFKNGDRADYKYNGPLPLADDGTKTLTCNEYIFGEQLKHGFNISDTFKDNIKIIKRLQNKGINIVVTWPAVVGDDCYKDKYSHDFHEFIALVKIYLDNEHIDYIGNVEDSKFDKTMILNTYYHVNDFGRDLRTQKLIGNIRSSKINDFFENTAIKKSILIEDGAFDNVMGSIKPLESAKKTYFTTKKLTNNVWLLSGWYPIEAEGVWSKGAVSKIAFKTEENFNNEAYLSIEADTFGEKNPTRVYINNIFLGSFLLDGEVKIAIPPNINLKNDDGLSIIYFLHDNIKTPAEYGMNDDDRKLKLRLRSFAIDY